MNISLNELKIILNKYPEQIIEKIYYYSFSTLDYKIQRNIINYSKNELEYSIYSYVNYISITYKF